MLVAGDFIEPPIRPYREGGTTRQHEFESHPDRNLAGHPLCGVCGRLEAARSHDVEKHQAILV